MLMRVSPTEDSPGLLRAVSDSLAEGQLNRPFSPPRSKPIDISPAHKSSSPPLAHATRAVPRIPSPSKVPPPNLEDIIKNIEARKALEVPRLNVPNGDTWIFIDPPPKQPEQDNESYHLYVERSKAPRVTHSSMLLALKSPFFDKAMGPTAQHRVIRRRGLVNKLPPHIKYVLDLTPPSEGDEAAYLLSELSCSPGVTKWVIAGKIWRISKTLIGGQEEYSLYDRLATEATVQKLKAEITNNYTDEVERQHAILKLEESFLPIPLPYTALRHRSAIERVLLAISGFEPELNSAPKVWTACAIARYFDVRTPFDDYVVRWLRADPNHHFLEVLPEVSLKIADGLQCHDVCRDAFAILVGEEALSSCYRNRSKDRNLEVIRGVTSVHGRKKEDLHEVYQTRVEYASKALIERVADYFKTLIGLEWIDGLPEVKKHASRGLPAAQACLETLKARLKAYVRGAIFRALCVKLCIVNQFSSEFDYTLTNDLFPNADHRQVWNDLLPRERLLTRSFWKTFSSRDLFAGATNVDIDGRYTGEILTEAPTDAEVALRNEGVFEIVKMTELEEHAALYQQLRHPRNNARSAPPSHTAESNPWTDIRPISTNPRNTASSHHFLGSGQIAWDPLERDTNLVEGLTGDSSGNTEVQPILFRGRPLTREEHEKVCVFMKSWVSGDQDRLSQALQFPYEWFDSYEVAGVHTGIYDEVAVQLDAWEDGWTDSWLRAYEEGTGAFYRPYDRFHGAFSLHRFFDEAFAYLRHAASKILTYTDTDLRAETHPLRLSDFLVSLEDSEFKYLPLWAGGCDDGSGGVFDDDVPIAAEGFSHPGPNVHLGTGSSAASSEYDFIRGVSSHNTSTLTQGLSEGTSTGSVRSASENNYDPFADAEELHAPSTPADSEYDFGSVTSVGVGSTTDRLARFGLGAGPQMSEKAKGKMPVRDTLVETAYPQSAPIERGSANSDTSGAAKAHKVDPDEDFNSIFDDDEEDGYNVDVDADDGDEDYDDGNDSDDTVGESKYSDDDMVMV